jgi:GDP-L-galactose phosphorylase
MSLTIKRVPTVISIHQLEEVDDPKANTVQKVCAPGSALPTLSYAPKRSAIKAMKKVRSFGSFDDLRVPDLASERDSLNGSDQQVFNNTSERASDDGSGSDGDTGSTGGGYVQDVSPFDRILLSAWEDRFAAGLFRYDVTACKTKVVPGPFGFVAQFNEGRATKKRPTEFSVDKVNQAFDASKFNFTKADKSEILFAFRDARSEDSSKDSSEAQSPEMTSSLKACTTHGSTFDAHREIENNGTSPTVVLINVSPIEYGHVLLCPRVLEGLPQSVSPEILLPPLMMASESRNPYFRVGYNSLGAYATINHLHFQAYYLMEAFPIERAPTARLPANVFPHKRQRNGIKVSEVLEYPVKCLCFERGDGFESLAHMVGTACQRLQERNVPFNLLIADHGARVFLIPQKFSQRIAKGEVPEDVVATGVNPAVFEISGHLLYKTQEDYDDCSQKTAERMLECASLTETDFYETVAHALDEEAPSGLPAMNRDDTQNTFSLEFMKCGKKLASIRGSVDGNCSEARVTIDAAIKAVKGDVSPSSLTGGPGSSVSSGDAGDAVVPC